MGVIASIETVVGFIGDAVKYGPLVVNFIQSTVTAVETTGKSGVDKLTAVLNAVQTLAVGLIPNEAAMIEAFMAAVEALVNDFVELFNDVGVFLHGGAAA